MRDGMKIIYAKMMLAAAPMFEKLTPPEQQEVVQRVANALMSSIQNKQLADHDYHIVVKDDPKDHPIMEQEPALDAK